nr:chemotaxis protein CheW [uncultured Methanospirillum sp.]
MNTLEKTNPNKNSTDDEIQVVEFILGDNKFAINLFDVREIVESMRITPLPHTPSHIRGIIDLRGEITTVIDLKSLLKIQKSSTESQTDSRLIVLDSSLTAIKTGILVDDVSSVMTVSMKDIDQSHTDDEDAHILGIIKKSLDNTNDSRRELVIWLDIKALLDNVTTR